MYFISGTSLILFGLTVSIFEIKKDKVTNFIEKFRSKIPSFDKKQITNNATIIVLISVVFQIVFFSILFDAFENPYKYISSPEQNFILRGVLPVFLILTGVPMTAIGVSRFLLGISKISSRGFFYTIWVFAISYAVVLMDIISPQRCGHCF